jgi:D-erythro-7,8-dihydroneopterin triphosphate epimerase
MPQLQPGMARIRVKDLCLRTFIGINEDEILNKQDVLINLTILYAAQEAVRDNDIDHALNYRTITKAVIAHVEENRFALLERLTQELLDLVMANDGGAVCRSRSRQAARPAFCRIGIDHPGGQPLSWPALNAR